MVADPWQKHSSSCIQYSIINQKNTLCMPGIYYCQFYFSLLILIVFIFQDILQRGSVQQLVLHVLHARDQGQVSPTDQADLHSYRRKSLRIHICRSGCQEDVLKKKMIAMFSWRYDDIQISHWKVFPFFSLYTCVHMCTATSCQASILDKRWQRSTFPPFNQLSWEEH